ncbi:hypothetical protein [Actinomadura sp. DC4]|uniref:hypothetical protein n=1 Tax=Actinomadura sp. DC4 TaxID=3055069 RepID=UPI0025AFE101|nr:hypothetical protein [Actinomadura sp. DC4]MDN3359587.1 hypothetical protein [Actinomadura sp. DC4]
MVGAAARRTGPRVLLASRSWHGVAAVALLVAVTAARPSPGALTRVVAATGGVTAAYASAFELDGRPDPRAVVTALTVLAE